MILGKTLLLKGLAGVTALAGSTIIGFGIKNNWWQKSSAENIVASNNQDLNGAASETNPNPQEESIVKKAGLNCEDENNANGSNCTKKDDQVNISVKQDNTTFDVSTITGGKIKLYKLEDSNTDYNKGLKFVIEEGDINGTTTSNKLEQFETYEIEEEVAEGQDKKYYLKRKHTAIKEKEIILGLPTGCNLPNGTSACTDVSLDSQKLNNLNFEGKSDSSQASIDSGASVTLSITKETVDTNVFTDGYKFSFKTSGTGDVTITGTSETITLKPNTTTEFKIKKENQNLFLEKAWDISKLSEKVGLECNTDSSCTQKSGQKTNIKHESELGEKTLTINEPSKIKVYKETSGYNEGFKFVIEEGDITFDTDKKLEEGDTYEIKKEGDKWYFFRKTESESKKIRKALGLPEGCKLPKEENNPITCENIDVEKLKKLNFEGKDINGSWTIGNSSETTTLKITKTSDTSTFPKGYRFAFEGDKEISIPLTSNGSITLKKNTNTEFKIKENGSESFSLEKAWTISTLSAKVNLSGCTASSDSKKECTFGERINFFKDNGNNVVNKEIEEQSRNKKIKYEEDQEGYNQGFKFTLEENILLKNASTSLAMIDAKSSNQQLTYEIKEQTVNNVTNWYLTKKTNT